jgi:hypothetical protein
MPIWCSRGFVMRLIFSAIARVTGNYFDSHCDMAQLNPARASRFKVNSEQLLALLKSLG